MRSFLQFSEPVSRARHLAADTWYRVNPNDWLRVYGNYEGEIRDLDFLRFYRHLKRFEIDSMSVVPDLSGLALLPDDLDGLGLMLPSGESGEALLQRCQALTILRLAGHKKVPASVAHLHHLRELYIEGPIKDLSAVADLRSVEEITLRSVSMPDLAHFLNLGRLRSLDIKLGGIRDLDLLPELGCLTSLELWRIRGLSNISSVGRISSLETLKLESLRQVTTLPDFSGMTHLTSIELGNMKGLTDMSPLATAPALKELWVWQAEHVQPEAFASLVGHPTLERATIGLGSDRKNNAVKELLRLPPVR